MIQKMIDVRTDHDETQRELAKAIGYHQVQIARYETGENTTPIQYRLILRTLPRQRRLYFKASEGA